jgi:REP element-mobilizing transposase RayT
MSVAGGWYHVFSRGHNRERIFSDRVDYDHFLELLSEMRERYRVRVYAYSLMGNHYHILIKTPEGNISRAIQWLNGSYGVWHAKRHERSGHLFGGRFKAILVEGSAWGLEVSVYIHMNCVATMAMELGKTEREAQKAGLAKHPTSEQVERRLGKLREFKWSSYRAYAGYEKASAWLDIDGIRSRAGGEAAEEQEKRYVELVEDRIRQGVAEPLMSSVKWGVVLGGERFARKVRGKIRIFRESGGRRELTERREFADIVKMVERIKGKVWREFKDSHGDWGRDLALWAGRRYCGMTLSELGDKAGDVDYTAIAMALKRLEERAKKDKSLRSALKAVRTECEK